MAGAHVAIHDSEDRPIAAGGFVKSGHGVYQDISKPSGLASWAHVYLPTIDRIFIAQHKDITGALCNAKKR